jgi:hypothetical protein
VPKRNREAPRNQRRAAEAKADAEYEVAKEKCDDQKGEQKDACEKQAKAQRDQARASIKKQYAQKQDQGQSGAAAGATKKPAETK